MPGQDKQAGRVGEPSGSEEQVLLTVPSRIVYWLRQAAFAEIASAAQAIDAVAFVDGREAHREWFLGPAQDLKGIFALLETIGWSGTVPPVDVQVDLRTDRRALMSALEEALEFAEADANRAVRRDHAEQAEPGLPAERDAEVERVGVLRDIIAEAQVRIDAFTAKEGGA